jgi:hypothetical protein
MFRIARIPHSTLRLGSICMDLRARVLESLTGDSFLASFGNILWIRLSNSPSSHSLLVLADPLHSRLVRGGFGYSLLHKIPLRFPQIPQHLVSCFLVLDLQLFA